MSFTLPVGNFQPVGTVNAIIRPTSVVDTVATGTITNSSNAYDTDQTSYGVWTGIIPSSGPILTYSTASGSTLGKSVYAIMSANSSYPVWAGYIRISIDNGVTYPYAAGNYFPQVLTPVASTYSCSIPDGILYTNIKIQTAMINGHGQPTGGSTDLRVYDIYIQ
jgi:hypothetical protein